MLTQVDNTTISPIGSVRESLLGLIELRKDRLCVSVKTQSGVKRVATESLETLRMLVADGVYTAEEVEEFLG